MLLTHSKHPGEDLWKDPHLFTHLFMYKPIYTNMLILSSFTDLNSIPWHNDCLCAEFLFIFFKFINNVLSLMPLCRDD